MKSQVQAGHRRRILCVFTAEMATRIAAVLGTSAQYWLNLQNAVDLYVAEQRLADADQRPQIMSGT